MHAVSMLFLKMQTNQFAQIIWLESFIYSTDSKVHWFNKWPTSCEIAAVHSYNIVARHLIGLQVLW